MDDQRRDELVALEERFWLEGGGNPSFWQRHFADDGLVSLAFGILDKPQTVTAMEQGSPWARIDMQDLHVIAADDTSCLVTYRAIARRAGDERDYEAITSSLYVRRDGSWRLLFHQQTPTAAPPTG